MKKSIYVTGIVKDSKKNIEKYLFSENERLNAIIDELEEINEDQLTEIFMLSLKIKKAIKYIKTWVLDEYSIAVLDEKDDICDYEPNAKEKLLEILGADDNEET